MHKQDGIRKWGQIVCRIYTFLGASFVLDPAVIPPDATFLSRPLPARHWVVSDGPCGKTAFCIFYNGDRARSVWVRVPTTHNVARDLGAYVRRTLKLPRTIAFKEGWTATMPLRRVAMPIVWIEGFHGDTRTKIKFHEKMCSIRAYTFGDLEYVAAAIMHKEPFAPIGERFFGFDSDELRRISRCAVEDVIFRWCTRGMLHQNMNAQLHGHLPSLPWKGGWPAFDEE